MDAMISTEQYDMPAAIEAEQAIIGAILKAAVEDSQEAMETAAELLQGDEFFLEKHRIIFSSMLELLDELQPVDLVTLTGRMTDRGSLDDIGGVPYLRNLLNSVPSVSNLEYYANQVKQKCVHRKAITELQQQLRAAIQGEETGKLLKRMADGVENLTDQATPKEDFRTARDIAFEFFANLEEASNARNNGKITGIPSGYDDLDKMTSGFQRSDLIIVAARPSVGKTAFALNVAQNVGLKANEPVAIFSLEMGATQLMQRMVGSAANMDQNALRAGDMKGDDWEKLTMAIGTLSEAPIYINDSGAVTVAEIRSKCRRLKKEKGLGLIMIDYLQLIQGRGRKSRQEEVGEISRGLKQIARELDVPVIALSQLSRGVEQRADKRPLMSDLRDSGSIEQDADIVAFLYRDDYYDKETAKKNIVEVILAKQRNGPVGTVELAFLKQFGKFLPLDRGHQEAAGQQTMNFNGGHKNQDQRHWA